MWIAKWVWTQFINDRKAAEIRATGAELHAANVGAAIVELRAQKAKDDITIDWMRHRINALEKQNAILLQKAAGVIMPVPEIVPTRPGTMTVPDFSSMPSFEDVGDVEAARLGIAHDEAGFAQFRDEMKTANG